MKGIKSAKIILPEGQVLLDHVLLYDEKIEGILPLTSLSQEVLESTDWLDAKGLSLVPGFIDVHVHGYKGRDVMEGSVDALEALSLTLPENGVTAFLATTMTMPLDRIEKALDAVNDIKGMGKGARILGAHLEGPYINEAFKGAQPAEAIRVPSEELLNKYENVIKVVTIAPEAPGALKVIEAYKDRVNFSLGHSGASFEQGMEAFEKGAKGVTHLFNAMTGLHHRQPGLVGAALCSDCYAELIADKIHVHPGIFNLLAKAKGLDRLLLVTDCMEGGGLPEGDYELGGHKVKVKDGKCTLASGTIAGSVLKLKEGLQNYMEASGRPLEEVVSLVSANQAKYLGLDHEIGSLKVGLLADMCLLNEANEVVRTIVKGKCVYENQL